MKTDTHTYRAQSTLSLKSSPLWRAHEKVGLLRSEGLLGAHGRDQRERVLVLLLLGDLGALALQLLVALGPLVLQLLLLGGLGLLGLLGLVDREGRVRVLQGLRLDALEILVGLAEVAQGLAQRVGAVVA